MGLEVTPNDVVARNIATYRSWRGLSQDDLADRLESIGFATSRRSIRRLESGEKSINVDDLFALALCLETTVDKLLSLVDRNYQAENQVVQLEFARLGSEIETVPIQTANAVLSDDDSDLLHIPEIGISWDDRTEPAWRIPVEHPREIMRSELIESLRSLYDQDVSDDMTLEDIGKLLGELQAGTLAEIRDQGSAE